MSRVEVDFQVERGGDGQSADAALCDLLLSMPDPPPDAPPAVAPFTLAATDGTPARAAVIHEAGIRRLNDESNSRWGHMRGERATMEITLVRRYEFEIRRAFQREPGALAEFEHREAGGEPESAG